MFRAALARSRVKRRKLCLKLPVSSQKRLRELNGLPSVQLRPASCSQIRLQPSGDATDWVIHHPRSVQTGMLGLCSHRLLMLNTEQSTDTDASSDGSSGPLSVAHLIGPCRKPEVEARLRIRILDPLVQTPSMLSSFFTPHSERNPSMW